MPDFPARITNFEPDTDSAITYGENMPNMVKLTISAPINALRKLDLTQQITISQEVYR